MSTRTLILLVILTILILSIGLLIGISNIFYVPEIEAPVYMKTVIWAPNEHKAIPVIPPSPIDADGDPGHYSEHSKTISGLTPFGKRAFIKIANASLFSLDGVGWAPREPQALEALKQMLWQENAKPAFQERAMIATPEGKLFALWGLYVTDQAEYKSAISKLHNVAQPKVLTASGCTIMERDFFDALSWIESEKASEIIQKKDLKQNTP